jgi:curved DNA-binding protein CbpA
MTDDLDFYDLLGVSEEASQEQIRKGFRRQVREYHPDLNDDPRAPAQFTALKKAYDTLGDPKEREAYDRMGHREYVRNRISGLPSPDDWQIPESEVEDRADDGGHAGPAETGVGGNGTADRDGPASAAGDGPRPGGSTGTAGSGGEGRNGESAASVDPGETGRSLGPDPDPDPDPGSGSPPGAGGGTDADAASGGGATVTGTDRWRSVGTTGAGTARDPDAVPFGGTETGESGGADSGAAVDGTTAPVGERIREAVDAAVASVFGWPLVLAADLLFFAGVGLYVAGNAAGVERLVDRVAAAGLDPGAVWAALGTRPEGLEPLSSFVGSGASGSVPAAGLVALVGIAFLPSVYFFLVRWTRKNRLPWQPSYLYVLGALAPVAGLVVSGVADPGGVYVEVVLYCLVPAVTVVAMLFFGQIKPRVERLVRRWRYRLGE